MRKQSQLSQEREYTARIVLPVPRWLRLVALLALTLGVGSSRQTVFAQDDPAVTVHGYMKVVGPKDIELCVDDSASITVVIERDLKDTETDILGGETDHVMSVSQIGIKIGASLTVPNVVTLADPTQYTSMVNTPPGTATFKIRGQKPGSTKVYISAVLKKLSQETLDGPIGTNIVDATVSVKVQKCKYKVKAISQWHLSSADGGGNFVVSTKEAVLTADADGHYTGSASVTWVASVIITT